MAPGKRVPSSAALLQVSIAGMLSFLAGHQSFCGGSLVSAVAGTAGYGCRIRASRSACLPLGSGLDMQGLKKELCKFQPADQRMRRLGQLTDGEMYAFGIVLSNGCGRIDPRLKAIIDKALVQAIGRRDWDIAEAGSVRTGTAISDVSDLDVNIYTSPYLVTEEDRIRFKEELERIGEGFLHSVSLHSKCIKCWTTSACGDQAVDIAFADTRFVSGVLDRGDHVDFFEGNPVAQTAVRIFKFVFNDACGLPGFIVEELAMARAGARNISLNREVVVSGAQTSGAHMVSLRGCRGRARCTLSWKLKRKFTAGEHIYTSPYFLLSDMLGSIFCKDAMLEHVLHKAYEEHMFNETYMLTLKAKLELSHCYLKSAVPANTPFHSKLAMHRSPS